MKYLIILTFFIFTMTEGSSGLIFTRKDLKNLLNSGALDLNVLRCLLRTRFVCPSPYLTFLLHTPKSSRHGVVLNVNNPLSLYQGGFSKHRETVIIVHGFNGSISDKHQQYLRDAYLSRDYNVIAVNWGPLTLYPCYLHSLVNTRLTAQCTAQVYAFLTHHGALREKITCVGHSLGAHICGMVSTHLSLKQYRIIGLDPAKPLIERTKSAMFRLTRDDAKIIQVVHTNAGFLGQEGNTGSLNYCVNGGRLQPYCTGNVIRRARCSHFLSVCYLANAVFKHKKFRGFPCPKGCIDNTPSQQLSLVTGNNPFGMNAINSGYSLGNDAADELEGVYCLDVAFAKHCPFVDVT